jgi:hypothetical protein
MVRQVSIPMKLQFSLRGLLWGVAATAVVAAMTRLSPEWVALSLAFGLLSAGGLSLATWLVIRADNDRPETVAYLAIVAGPSFLLGIVFGLLSAFASMNVAFDLVRPVAGH